MHKDKYCGEVYFELTFWLDVRVLHFFNLGSHGAEDLAFIGTPTDQKDDP